jgi:hypothetical protein
MPPYLRLFLYYSLLALPICLQPAKRSVCAAGVLILVIAVKAMVVFPTVADLSLLLLAHQLVWALVHPVPERVTRGVLAYAFMHFYLFISPLGYPVTEALARFGCQVSRWMTGSSFNLGPTYQNLGGFLLFLSLSLSGLDRSRVAKGRTASFLAVAILLNALLAMLLIRKVNFGADLVWQLKLRDVFGYGQLWQKVRGLAVLVFPAAAFLAWLIVYMVLHYEVWLGQGETARLNAGGWGVRELLVGSRKQLWVVATAVVLLLLIVPPTAWRHRAGSNLVFVERGVVSFTKPDYTRFGRAAGGMFGMLPDYSRLFGCRAVVVRDVPESLSPDQVLVLTNLDEPLAPEVHRRIWDFVAAGGRLWVLGDHTFMKNGRNHINDVLVPCHIALNHDSAQFFPQGWFHSYQFLGPFDGLQDLAENRPAILVGASLDLKVPAQPFILGRFGYSDWGVTIPDATRGYIGDFKYQPEERLGDLVLVAGERYGKGRVLVFGDTTSFFNNNLSRSFELLRVVLSWLGESPGWLALASWPARIASAVVLAGFCVLVFILKSAQPIHGTLLAALLASLVAHWPAGLLPFDTDYSRRRTVVIDFAHEPFTSKHSSMDSGLHGVSINLMRYGLLPLAINDWDPAVLGRARLVVLNAPRRPFTRPERRHLTRFMERGGTVWLGCGYPHYESCRSLLAPLGLRLRGLPLGRFFDRPAFGQRISFFSAWPIEVDHPDASVICFYDDWPLIAMVPVGQGRLVLIGDSEFLQNRNLEGLENYDPANIQFIRSLLDYTVGGVGT